MIGASGMPGVSRHSFTTSDLGEAEEFVGVTYAEAVLHAPAGFGCRHRTVEAARFAMSSCWSTTCTARVEPLPETVLVSHVDEGRARWDSARYGELDGAEGSSVLVPPRDRFSYVGEAPTVRIVALDSAELAEYAAHRSGVEDLVFSGLSPISGALDDFWQRSVAHVRDDVLGNPVAADSRIALTAAFRSLAAALLSVFPNSALAAATDPERPAVRGQVPGHVLREVTDFLTTHADRTLGPADIADLAGRPAREIVEGLRRRKGTHPSQLLYDARLRGAHRSLADADPHGTLTVYGIAVRWGFTHLARFRIAYTYAFDEEPEHTLQR